MGSFKGSTRRDQLQKLEREGKTSALEVRLENRSEETWYWASACTETQEPPLVERDWYLDKYLTSSTPPQEDGEDLEEEYEFWVKRGSMPRSIQNIYKVYGWEVSPNQFIEFDVNDNKRLGCAGQSLDSLWFYREERP